jgi:predicted nucleotidyltransferase
VPGPPFDDPAKVDAIRAVLDRPEVVAAYLCGSRLRGDHRPDSDVDVAVWMRPDLELRPLGFRELAEHPAVAELRAQLEVVAAVPGCILDLFVLESKWYWPLFGVCLPADGLLIVDRDPAERRRYEDAARVALEAGEWPRGAQCWAQLEDGTEMLLENLPINKKGRAGLTSPPFFAHPPLFR